MSENYWTSSDSVQQKQSLYAKWKPFPWKLRWLIWVGNYDILSNTTHTFCITKAQASVAISSMNHLFAVNVEIKDFVQNLNFKSKRQ